MLPSSPPSSSPSAAAAPNPHEDAATTAADAAPSAHPLPSSSHRIAVIDSNMLACMGMVSILSRVVPMVAIDSFHSFEALRNSETQHYLHYFVSARIFFEHTQFFRRRPYQSIVLTLGENLPPMQGVRTLNVARSEQELLTDLLQLHQHGHGQQATAAHLHRMAHPHRSQPNALTTSSPLTTREIEVLTLLAKGMINKEVAHQLCISLPTVITHRRNIMAKLHAHSLSDLIIFAVLNGYLDLGE